MRARGRGGGLGDEVADVGGADVSRHHSTALPELAMPAARVLCPGRAPAVPHSDGWMRGPSVTAMKNVVEPYMTMRSPGRPTSTLSASAHASHVPAATGLPTGIPVAAAAAALTRPDLVRRARPAAASACPAAISSQRSAIQAVSWRSYSGVALAGGVLVQHVLARQPEHEVGVRT